MVHDADRRCHCSARHQPAPLELNRHHILPLADGGPDVDSNVVWLCPTAHVNVHELLRLFVVRKGALSWGFVTERYEQPVNRHAFEVAREGWRRMQAREAAR